MRALLIGVVGLAACGKGETMYYLASTQGEISGVAMRSEPGLEQDAQVGMNDLTCLLGIGSGNVNQEWNYGDTAQEEVLDVAWQDGREVVAIKSVDTVHLQTNSSASTAESTDVGVPGVVDARLLDEGFVALVDSGTGCSVSWSDGASVPLEECPESIAAGPGSDVAYVGSDSGLWSVSKDDVQPIDDEESDLAAWDAASNSIYVAGTDLPELRILDPDGALVHELDLGYPIQSLDAQEGVGRVIAVVAVEEGGGIFLVDGVTGEVLSSQYTPIGPKEVSSSLDGRAFAIVDDDAVHFYGVGDGWEATGQALEGWEGTNPRNPTD